MVYPQFMNPLKAETLSRVNPLVNYGMTEAQKTSFPHAMMEIAAIAYLMGKGYDLQTAHMMVESWETNETFI